MRTHLLFSVAGALAGLSLAGCSLAYNGSRFQGGTGSDSGTPSDGGVDTGEPPVDGGGSCTAATCDPMEYCDSASGNCLPGCDAADDCTAPQTCDVVRHMCILSTCTLDAQCGNDEYCKSGACAACDADNDGYVPIMAPPSCLRAPHTEPDDCDDTNAAVHPFARVDCTTAIAEACPLDVLTGAGFGEAGITEVRTLWSGGTVRFGDSGHLGIVLGDDSPTLPSGASGGFVGFIGTTGTQHVYAGAPVTWEGTQPDAEVLYSGFDVTDAALGVTEGDGNRWIGLTLAGPSASAQLAYGQTKAQRPAMSLVAPAVVALSAGESIFPAMAPNQHGAVAIASWVDHPSGAVLLSSSSGPFAANAAASGIGHRTGLLAPQPQTWLAGDGAAVMWVQSDTTLGLWNGAEAGAGPSVIDLSAYTSISGGPPQLLTSGFRGSIGHSSVRGSPTAEQHYVAAVVVGSTATPPTGQIVLLRWTMARPTSGSDPTVTQGAMIISSLELGTGFRPRSGVSVYVVDDTTTLVSYVQGLHVVVRAIRTISTSPGEVETAPTLDAIPLGALEQVEGLTTGGGLFLSDPRGPASGGIGRLAVAALIQNGARYEIRARALEACVTP